MDNLPDNIENLDVTIDNGNVTITPSPIVVSEDDYKEKLQSRLDELNDESTNLDSQKASVVQAISDIQTKLAMVLAIALIVITGTMITKAFSHASNFAIGEKVVQTP